jgi:hypothetical protein
MLLRLATLSAWVKPLGLTLLMAVLLLMGGCTADQLGDFTVATAATVAGSLILCVMFYACHF